MTFEVEPARLGRRHARHSRARLSWREDRRAVSGSRCIEHVDELTDAARRCGSINCVTADWRAASGRQHRRQLRSFRLLRQQVDPVGRRAMIVGAGRLARAVAMALADAGVTAITITSRNATAGQQLVECDSADSRPRRQRSCRLAATRSQSNPTRRCW